MKKTIFVLLVILPLMAGNGFATVYTGSLGPELTYTLDSGTGHVVIEGRGAMTSDDLSNYPKREYVKTVSFPEGLTSICANAFHGCYNLQSIVLPDSVVSIGAYAFQECTNMTSVNLGKGIKTIGDQAFIFCSALRKVRWSDCLESIGDMAFYNCTNIGDTVFFPKTFKTMGWGAFGSENYNSASKVMVWEAIHANDFVRYESDVPGECHFSYVIFGDSVEYIPNMLCKFMYNDSITLPETVKAIGASAFTNCSRLQKIHIPEGVTSIGASAFANCAKLKQLVLPSGLKEIPEQLCSSCNSLDSVKLPAGLTVIPQKAFSGCGLGRVTIPNSVTNIGNSAFAGCPLHTLVLPSALNVLGDNVFNQLNLTTSMKHLVLPNNLVATGMGTFCNWSELQTITIGRNVAILGQDCFFGDSLVTDITCYAAQPPLIYDGTFNGVPDTATVHVPSGSVAAYKSAQYWSRFRIVALDEEEIIQKKVTVEAGETTADFTWPTDSTAHSYQIDIYKDGAVFCKLTLGARGELLGISFSAPKRKNEQMVNDQMVNDSQPYTLSFKVTGLDEASRYTYVLSVLDENNTPLHVYIGDFATLGYPGELKYDGNELIPTPPIIPGDPDAQTPTGVWEVQSDDVRCTKVIHDGKLYLMYKGTMYNVQGRKVYGEQ
ncbi:MAG: leucine-rich repeat domain-containing protein [Paludibacteraceae bacterium]|nr:leucine-rich repeat domain-containing protein [Paludibacteraceae bacterium]